MRLLLYEVLRVIPVLGWVIEGIVTIRGLGAIWLAYHRAGAASRSVPQAEDVDQQVHPALGLEPWLLKRSWVP